MALPCTGTDFHDLVTNGLTARVKAAIKQDSRLAGLKDELGRSPLQLAAEAGHLDLVNILINAGADLDHCDRLKGYTALHYAAMHNFPKILSFLLSRGADLHLQDNDGNFPLHLCVANGCFETVEILVNHSADVNCMNRAWQTPLHLAAFAGKNRQDFPYARNDRNAFLKIAAILVSNGAYPSLRDNADDLPATIAARHHPGSAFLRKFLEILHK